MGFLFEGEKRKVKIINYILNMSDSEMFRKGAFGTKVTVFPHHYCFFLNTNKVGFSVLKYIEILL
jgi:hypothetical protein